MAGEDRSGLRNARMRIARYRRWATMLDKRRGKQVARLLRRYAALLESVK
jgi:hypothetical protein